MIKHAENYNVFLNKVWLVYTHTAFFPQTEDLLKKAKQFIIPHELVEQV